ncbi:MAG: hypothetical protein IT567_07080 [Alphaproteobacteria bacterium]|nr:hypothetical protein [Alphaproteobacteria bacterium]
MPRDEGADIIFQRLRILSEDIEEQVGWGHIPEERGQELFRQLELLVDLADYTGIRMHPTQEGAYQVSDRRLPYRLEVLVSKGYIRIVEGLEEMGFRDDAAFIREFTGAIAQALNIHRPGPGVQWRE